MNAFLLQCTCEQIQRHKDAGLRYIVRLEGQVCIFVLFLLFACLSDFPFVGLFCCCGFFSTSVNIPFNNQADTLGAVHAHSDENR